MKQPSKKKKPRVTITGTGLGIRTCTECPFLLMDGVHAICNASDVEINYIVGEEILVPDWCGNKKEDEKRV